MNFLETNQIKIEPPKRPKKITGTRFATIMNLNAWNTAFGAWCEITRTYEEPFEETKYTKAGKVIEPKIAEYLKKHYFMKIKSPSDVYGDDYFKKTFGDFFPHVNVFGGMWDFIGDDFVVEVKTTKRVEDWVDADGKLDPPLYYKLQAGLYAYLLGFDNVVMTCSFLTDDDYEHPEDFIPNVKNTLIHEFKMSEDFPNFVDKFVEPALTFWDKYVVGGISPVFDEQRDADILKALRKNTIEPTDEEIQTMIAEADALKEEIDEAESKIIEKKDRLKELDDNIKKYMCGQFRDGDKKVEITGSKYTWTLTKSERIGLDSTTLKKELPDVFSKYSKKSEVYTLKKSI